MAQSPFTYQPVEWSRVKAAYLQLFATVQKIGKEGKSLAEVLDAITYSIDRFDTPEASLERALLSLLDIGLAGKIEKMIGGAKDTAGLSAALAELGERVQMIAAGIGVFAAERYQPGQTINYLTGKDKTAESLTIIRTLGDSRFGEKESRDIDLAILQFLGTQKGVHPGALPEAMVLSLALMVLYEHFARLNSDQQRILLSRHFYQAITVGVPVREMLATALTAIPGVIEYMNTNRAMSEAIETSEEEISLDPAKPIGKLSALLKEFLAGVGDRAFDDSEQRKFSSAKAPGREALFLREAIDISVCLREAVLVAWLRTHQKTRDEQYQIDLLQLIFSFGLHREFEFIKDYYKNKDALVPASVFLDKLQAAVHLADETDVQAVLHLTDTLHTANLLPPDKEIVVYNERTQNFEWQPLK